MINNSFDAILPIPSVIECNSDCLLLADIKNYYLSVNYPIIEEEISHFNNYYSLNLTPIYEEGKNSLIIKENSSLGKESWEIEVTTQNIIISGGDKNGTLYGLFAFIQMATGALVSGPAKAKFNCGKVCDHPRFAWRSFMLDSSRHFQSKDTIKQLIKVMAHLRLNCFHWHLTDNQGWRIASNVLPDMAEQFDNNPGQYTNAELQEVALFADKYGVEIIPEIDIPGHSRGLLKKHPEYACNPNDISTEYCLGNSETKKFLKNLFSELMEIFPNSRYIHIGGDEAETSHWEICPKCQKALQEKNLPNMRALENEFMTEMVNFISGKGRTPILWGTCSGQLYPKNAIIQAWLDIREPLRVANNGNKVIFSVHNSLYFDYPANQGEPSETWMFALPEEAVYMTDPYIIWEEKLKNTIIGTEACLWTETVPQWRIFSKIMPRIFAYAECAWSQVERKDWYSFKKRHEFLNAAGYEDYLRS